MELYSLEANRLCLDGGAMFGVVPKAMWGRWIGSDDLNRIVLACRCLAIKTGAGVVLLEGGMDFFMDPKNTGRYGVEGEPGQLVTGLEKAGIHENDVAYVVLSHLHFDHLGSLLPAWPAMQGKDWALRLPNARYVTGRRQFEFSKNPHYRDRASYIPGVAEKFIESGRLVLLDDTDPHIPELDNGFSFFYTDGHTPGMLHTLVKGARHSILFIADLVPGTLWVHLPVVMGYDRFPEQTVNEKKEILDQAIAENWYVFYPHDPDVCASRIIKNEKGRYEAVEPIKILNKSIL